MMQTDEEIVAGLTSFERNFLLAFDLSSGDDALLLCDTAEKEAIAHELCKQALVSFIRAVCVFAQLNETGLRIRALLEQEQGNG